MPEFQNPERLWTLALLPVLIIAYLIILRLRADAHCGSPTPVCSAAWSARSGAGRGTCSWPCRSPRWSRSASRTPTRSAPRRCRGSGPPS
ncbi:hypothetical protein [Tessaracoccus coleopterorum]|uniref:hypothetical protein n=1 Tax=Tessaracoccus coleopterorum TaxID=2714950 RepID=UPI0038CD9A9A